MKKRIKELIELSRATNEQYKTIGKGLQVREMSPREKQIYRLQLEHKSILNNLSGKVKNFTTTKDTTCQH